MKRTVLALALSPLLVTTAVAEFEAGRTAYMRGDYRSAYTEFLPPATRGDDRSRIGLGLLHARGQAVSRDYVEAYKWFDLAATQKKVSHPVIRILAQTNRDYLAKRMSTVEIGEAKIEVAAVAAAGSDEGAITGVTGNVPSNALALLPPRSKRKPPVARKSNPSPTPNRKSLTDKSGSASLVKRTDPLIHIQLASYHQSRSAGAMAAWGRLVQRHRVLSGLEPRLRQANLGEMGKFRRLQAGPFESFAEARRACKALHDASQECFVVNN
jgi:hypothetical protein